MANIPSVGSNKFNLNLFVIYKIKRSLWFVPFSEKWENQRCVRATQSCVGNLIGLLLGHLWLGEKRKKVGSLGDKRRVVIATF